MNEILGECVTKGMHFNVQHSNSQMYYNDENMKFFT